MTVEERLEVGGRGKCPRADWERARQHRRSLSCKRYRADNMAWGV